MSFQSSLTYLTFGTPWELKITHIYEQANNSIYPVGTDTSCVALFLNNFADVEWINIDCTDTLSTTILCKRNISEFKHMTLQEGSGKIYPQDCTRIKQVCVLFVWHSKKELKHLSFHPLVDATNIEELVFLFKAIRENFPPIFLWTERTALTYKRYYDIFHYKKENTSTCGLLVKTNHPIAFVLGGNVLQCDVGYFISQKFVFKEQHACRNTSQKMCKCFEGNLKTISTLSAKHIIEVVQIESTDPFQKKWNLDKQTNCENFKFKCNDHQVISSCLVNDLVVDCDHGAEDERFLQMIAEESKQECQVKGIIQCRKGHPRCFNVSLVCKYQFNSAQVLFPCRTGEHLENCRGFVCNMMFKCPGSFCVPWGYVCNGRWDCPGGTDEHDNISCVMPRFCKNMFKCLTSRVCVHLSDVCDSRNDCPMHDDELYCSLHSVPCPKSCSCFLFSLKCSGLSYFAGWNKHLVPFHVIDIQNCTVTFFENFMKIVQNIYSLNIVKSGLVSLDTMCPNINNIKYTAEISLAHNLISALNSECLRHLSNLRIFTLKSNLIESTTREAFSSLMKLLVLDLSQNPLLELCLGSLLALPKLKFLIVQNIFATSSVERHCVANENNLAFLHTDDPHLCCLVSSTAACSAKQLWFLQCGSLLLNTALKIHFYFVSSLMLLLNWASLLISLKSLKSQNKAYSSTIASMNTADVLLALNLCIVWSCDLYFGNFFALREERWRKSNVCFVIFNLFFLASILSPSVQALLTLQRLCVVLFPLKTNLKQFSLVAKWIVSVFAVSISVSVKATLLLSLFHGTVFSLLCHPFSSILTHKRITIILITSVFFLHLFIILFTAIANTTMFFKITESHQFRGNYLFSHNLSLVCQLVFLLCIKILSWIPSGVVFMVILSTDEYPLTIPAWTIICVTTLNPLVIPFVLLKSHFGKTRK